MQNLKDKNLLIASINVDLTLQILTFIRFNGSSDGSYLVSTGKGKNCNCDDIKISQTKDSFCTPKGIYPALLKRNTLIGNSKAKWPVYFDLERRIALHYYPIVPRYPASSGCVRIAEESLAKLLHDNSVLKGESRNPTMITVRGIWSLTPIK